MGEAVRTAAAATHFPARVDNVLVHAHVADAGASDGPAPKVARFEAAFGQLRFPLLDVFFRGAGELREAMRRGSVPVPAFGRIRKCFLSDQIHRGSLYSFFRVIRIGAVIDFPSQMVKRRSIDLDISRSIVGIVNASDK